MLKLLLCLVISCAATQPLRAQSRIVFKKHNDLVAITSVDKQGVFKIQIENAPKWIHTFESHPVKLKPELKRGKWILVNYAVWSFDDILAIGDAIELVRPYSKSTQLAIRPYEGSRELKALFPDLDLRGASLYWIALSDGKVVAMRSGYDLEDIRKMVEAHVTSEARPAP